MIPKADADSKCGSVDWVRPDFDLRSTCFGFVSGVSLLTFQALAIEFGGMIAA
jgi:hypothetical protein